jgi:hypothetical protein
MIIYNMACIINNKYTIINNQDDIMIIYNDFISLIVNNQGLD